METIFQKARGDRWIWLVAILLSVFSILAVYSSTGTLAYRSANDGFTFSYLFRHGSVIVTGLVLMYIAHLINHRRSEEHTSELQSLMRTSYAVFCLKPKTRLVH